ncbi:MAG: HAMP domain-containing sensor histidine kinase [Isosphaeraceae bacterium]|nr:HAMP domain-containing sensor histidine kinase [Isosphaeraceae bacterium]
MSLTNRFSVLLLATLGFTLVGFSAALFTSSRIYLGRQADERLSAILTLLDTCVDPKPGWVRWEPRARRLPPSRWQERHATTWLVYDGEGRLLTSPRNLPREQLTGAWAPRRSTAALPDRVTDRKGRSWRVAQQRVKPTAAAEPGSERPADTSDGKSYHDEVLLAAFVSLDETEAALATLGWFLVCISTLIWVTAAVCARWLSRKTLVPLTRLVQSARNLDATNPGWSLPEVGTGDELDDLRNAFNDLLARLHEAYERQRRFSGDASHQLRTPVAVMIGHLEVAQRSERTAEDYLRVVRLAHRRAVALGHIVESLLFLSRAGSALLTRSEPLELGGWLIESMEGRAENARSGDVRIKAVATAPLWVNAQPHLLGQLVENLVENACKYSAPGTPVVVSLARDAGSALLSVEDSGCGIAPEDLPRIFEPFFRSIRSPRDGSAGVGLGLSVVERVATAFGGTVTAWSVLGHGSRFVVRLPLAAAPAPAGMVTVAERVTTAAADITP